MTGLAAGTPPERVTRLYVAGPITGLPEGNAPAFRTAGEALTAAGYEVLLPLFEQVEGRPWTAYMRRDAVAMMLMCDAVAALPGWQDSDGASLEMYLSTRFGMPFASVEDWLARPAPPAAACRPGWYVSRPGVTVRAWQWLDDDVSAAALRAAGAHLRATLVDGVRRWEVFDYVRETWIRVHYGDLVVRGTMGEFQPFEHGVFRTSYMPADPNPGTTPMSDTPGQ